MFLPRLQRGDTHVCSWEQWTGHWSRRRERECRALTSRQGHNVAVCSKGEQEAQKIISPSTKVTKVKRPKGETDFDVSKLKSGTPIVLSNDLYGIFMGKTKVLFVDDNIVQYMSLSDINIRSVMTYESRKAKMRSLNSILVTAQQIRQSSTLGTLGYFTNKDFVSYCMTRKKYAKARKLGFKITN